MQWVNGGLQRGEKNQVLRWCGNRVSVNQIVHLRYCLDFLFQPCYLVKGVKKKSGGVEWSREVRQKKAKRGDERKGLKRKRGEQLDECSFGQQKQLLSKSNVPLTLFCISSRNERELAISSVVVGLDSNLHWASEISARIASTLCLANWPSIMLMT